MTQAIGRRAALLLTPAIPVAAADAAAQAGATPASVDRYGDLKLKLDGYLGPGQKLNRNVLLDVLYGSLPRDSQAKVQSYNYEIAPGGRTSWHCHNGATFFVTLQGEFEGVFQEGVLVRAKAGDAYSEPVAKFHQGHNPHPELACLGIGIQITAPDREHIINVPARPW